jgi:putative hydrolase of the HAD superfamily
MIFKNIIFDLGNVLIDLNEKLTVNSFGSGISAFYHSKMNPDFVKTAHKFERGQISASEFKKTVSDIYNLNLSDFDFDNSWNAMILFMPDYRIKFLEKIKNKYRIFVLSNINDIHYNHLIKSDYWKPELFEKVYFSHLIGMRKPEPEIYLKVLNENNLTANETIFVDDNLENIEAAKKLGIHSIQIKNEVVDILKEILVL